MESSGLSAGAVTKDNQELHALSDKELMEAVFHSWISRG
jgi:hypothetical protein